MIEVISSMYIKHIKNDGRTGSFDKSNFITQHILPVNLSKELCVIPINAIQNDIGTEISQEGNANAYTRLFLLPNRGQVAKICSEKNELWEKNITNLLLILDKCSNADIPEIVLPTALLSYENTIVGYLMPYIEGNTLHEILTLQLRTRCEICHIFDRIASVIDALPNGIYVGDLHEKNVIVSNDNRVYLVDVDGFSVQDGFALTCPVSCEWNYNGLLPKRKYFRKDGSARIGKNTDILCICEMFFRWLMDDMNPYQFSIKFFFCL